MKKSFKYEVAADTSPSKCVNLIALIKVVGETFVKPLEGVVAEQTARITVSKE